MRRNQDNIYVKFFIYSERATEEVTRSITFIKNKLLFGDNMERNFDIKQFRSAE